MKQLILVFILSSVGCALAQTPPAPRHLEEIAFNTDNNTLLLSGGGEMIIGKSTTFPDYLSEWNGKTWTHIESPGHKNRSGHALVYDPNEKVTLLIGGVDQATRKAATEVWSWNNKQWKLVSSDCPIEAVEAVYDPVNKRILAFGPSTSELWEFKKSVWRKLSTEGPHISSPLEIAFDIARNALVIPTWDNGLPVVWEWQNEKWIKISGPERSISARNRFAMAYNPKDKVTYLFGGRNDADPFLNDLWKWDGKNWTAVQTKNSPPPRAAATMEYGKDGVYLYGGVAEWGLSNEIWKLKDGAWVLLNSDYAMTEARTAQSLREWLDKNPNDAEVLLVYGTLLGKQKKYDEAITLLKKAQSINPADHEPIISICGILYDQGKNTEAEHYVALAVSDGKMQRNSYARLANYFLGSKRLPSSVMCFEKALEMEPQAWDFYNLGCAYALQHNKDKAFEVLTKSIDLGVNSKQQYEGDPDLESLKSDPRWQTLLNKTVSGTR